MSLWTRWQEARKADPAITDKLTELTEPIQGAIGATETQPEHGFRQYCQNVSSAGEATHGRAVPGVLSVLSVCQFDPNPDPLAEAVAAAFADYAALDDPWNPEVWR